MLGQIKETEQNIEYLRDVTSTIGPLLKELNEETLKQQSAVFEGLRGFLKMSSNYLREHGERQAVWKAGLKVTVPSEIDNI